MKTNVYIDGFNLYYGALRGSAFKWLDLGALSKNLLPKNTINRIRYFTARVKSSARDPHQDARQDAYLRALRTIPNLEIHESQFLSHVVNMRLASPQPGGPYTVKVLKTEEKGSDVKLATYLLLDAFAKEYEVAVVISNDSDLEEPIRVVSELMGLKVGVINPHAKPSRELLKLATFYKPIRRGVLSASQFPNPVIGSAGSITKPSGW